MLVITLTLGIFSPVFADPALDESAQIHQHSEVLTFKLVKAPTHCIEPDAVTLLLVHDKNGGKISLANNSVYSTITSVSCDKSKPPIRKFVNRLTSKNGRVITLTGQYDMSKNSSSGTWTDNKGCLGTFANPGSGPLLNI